MDCGRVYLVALPLVRRFCGVCYFDACCFFHTQIVAADWNRMHAIEVQDQACMNQAILEWDTIY